MKTIEQMTLAEIVSENPSTARLFEDKHLDFCCKGKRTLEQACMDAGLDVSTTRYEIEELDYMRKQSNDTLNFNTMELDELADYIVHKHHTYVKEMMPMIQFHVRKVAIKHGESHPEALRIFENFERVVTDLEMHMMKEENILFPYIKKLVEVKNIGFASNTIHEFVKNPINVMLDEHDQVNLLLVEIRKLSNEFTPPADACTTFKLSYAELKEFEEDLHKHIHLENNLLFPKALQLEDLLVAGFHSQNSTISMN